MALTPATSRQVPDHAILDAYNKQNYLGNQYNFAITQATGGTSEVTSLYLSNPVVTTTSFQNQSALFVNLRRISGVTASANATMKVYLGPTISVAGTTQTPRNLRPAWPSTSIATLQSTPTATSNGTLIEGLSALALTSVQSNNLIILDPGKSILVTLQTSVTASVIVELDWYEL